MHWRVNAQELVHLHALLFELRAALEREGMVADDAFDAYEAQPVRPQHIHRSKEAHETAIGLLLDGLGQSVRIHPPPEHVSAS
ncbi:hypothetical protein BDK88_2580 [Natrinema hispanicum]|uniref:Metal-binding protein n=1 Tax=Natrinema hispanicum TaxID=392421 RepID=A0A482Y4X3_9EURY|nr:hypothetical protein BDK88_2580 [Natrinema hispanicum]